MGRKGGKGLMIIKFYTRPTFSPPIPLTLFFLLLSPTSLHYCSPLL